MRDDFGGLTYGAPTVYTCSIRSGGDTKLTDGKGVEFAPKDTFWVQPEDFVFGVAATPSVTWMIAEGDHRNVQAPETVGARQIRGRVIHRHKKFGQSQSWTLGT